MPATPTPDASQWIPQAEFVAPRVDLLLKELIRRLDTDLPPAIAATATMGEQWLFDGKPLEQTKGFYLAGNPISESVDLSDRAFLAFQVSAQPLLVDLYRTTGTLFIYVLGKKMQVDAMGYAAMARATLIAGYLNNYRNGLCDLTGKRVVRQLDYAGTTILPDEYAAYSGATLQFSLLFHPIPGT